MTTTGVDVTSAPGPSAKKPITTFFLGLVLLILLWLVTGCWIPYREVRPSLNVNYDNQDFISMVEIESGYRTWNPIGEGLSHGSLNRSYAKRTYDYVLLRWDTSDGHLLVMEPFASGNENSGGEKSGRLFGVAADVLVLGGEVHRHEHGSWRQVNAGREYHGWSGRDDADEIFSLDRRYHLYQEPGRIEVREVATGKVVVSRAIQIWDRFTQQVRTDVLGTVFIDDMGFRVLGVAHRRDGHDQERVVILDLRDGSTRNVQIDPSWLRNEPKADNTLIIAMDLVDDKLQFLVMASEPFAMDKKMMIRLRVISEKNVVQYDNAWRHEYQTEIEWRPRKSLLLMSDDTPTGSGLDGKHTQITRIDYASGQETTFSIAYPSEGEVIRQRPTQ